MSKDVLSKIRTNDVYKGLTRVLSDYRVEDFDVVDKRPHPAMIIRYCGIEREFTFPGSPRPGVNVKAYVAEMRRFLKDMQMESLELEKKANIPSKVGQVHVPMQGSLFNQQVDENGTPVVFVRDGEVFANSRDVAAFFDKNHRDVVRAIDNLVEQERDLGLRNFAQGSYTLESTGQQQHRCYDMDRDGFTLLAMGFTGGKALKWKLRYIEAFNTMEREIRNATSPAIDLNDPAWLRGQLLSYTERVIALEETVATQKPKVEALERIAEADGSLCITDAAKTLQLQPNVLFKWLDANGWTYVRPGTASRLAYQLKMNAGYLTHKVKTGPRDDGSEWLSTQVRVTPKGLAFLAEVFPPIARVA